MKRILAVLCVLAVLFQPVVGSEWHGHVHAEGATEIVCEQCGDQFDAQSEWIEEGGGYHIKRCIHGVRLPSSRHMIELAYESLSSTEHRNYCTVCGTGWNSSHRASCIASTVCIDCGAQDATDAYVEHNFTGEYESDASGHWTACVDCHTGFGREPHEAVCDAPSVCVVCGATGLSIDHVEHNWASEWMHDENRHWRVCPTCSQPFAEGAHQGNCNTATVCEICGATDVKNAAISHRFVEKHDEMEHWEECENCHEIRNGYQHAVTCKEQGVCMYCGATDIKDPEVYHNMVPQHNETEHWDKCADCGTIAWREAHWAYCNTPTVCGECGVTGLTNAILRHDLGEETGVECERGADSENHWLICHRCKDRVEIENHNWTTKYVDGQYHREECTVCAWAGETERHYVSCNAADQTACSACGISGLTDLEVRHYWMDYEYDGQKHWSICMDCETRKEEPHTPSADDPTKCADCGATIESAAPKSPCELCGDKFDEQSEWIWIGGDHMKQCIHGVRSEESRHLVEHMEAKPYTDTEHMFYCLDCDITWTESHWATCDHPTVCVVCGEKNVKMSIIDHELSGEYEHDAIKHWMKCSQCGQVIEKPHEASCSSPNVCYICNAENVQASYIEHSLNLEPKYNDNEHWYACHNCDELVYLEAHWAPCTDESPTKCAGCYAVGVNITKKHNCADNYESNADEHWQVCQDCRERVNVAAHTPSADDPSKCAVCGAPLVTPTAVPTVVPTAVPTAVPTVVPTAVPTAVPTVAPTAVPTVAPTAVPTVAPTVAPVHEHTYDVAFVTNNDGTHSKTCLAEDCNETITEACELVTTDMGLMLCTACAKCGYAVYTAKAGVEALAEDEDVPATIARVESASIAPVGEAAMEVVTEDTVLLVHETTFDVPTVLSEEIGGAVEKVFAASLIKNGESIQPNGTVQLRIPVDEGTVQALEGKVLMLLREDGTLVEIAFEVIDGEIVFLTEELGVFLLMEQNLVTAG